MGLRGEVSELKQGGDRRDQCFAGCGQCGGVGQGFGDGFEGVGGSLGEALHSSLLGVAAGFGQFSHFTEGLGFFVTAEFGVLVDSGFELGEEV